MQADKTAEAVLFSAFPASLWLTTGPDIIPPTSGPAPGWRGVVTLPGDDDEDDVDHDVDDDDDYDVDDDDDDDDGVVTLPRLMNLAAGAPGTPTPAN